MSQEREVAEDMTPAKKTQTKAKINNSSKFSTQPIQSHTGKTGQSMLEQK